MTVSKNLEAFLNFFAESVNEYNYASAKVMDCQNYTQDILHSLELDNLPYSERCKLMTKLMHCRQDRRYWKDRVEELEPLVSIFITIHGDNAERKNEVQRNSKVFNQLREALGKVRKQEAYHADRTYRPKIFTAMEKKNNS